MICRGLCACTEMLWMCVLYVSFGSKVRPRTFGCVAMGSALFFLYEEFLFTEKFNKKTNLAYIIMYNIYNLPSSNTCLWI